MYTLQKQDAGIEWPPLATPTYAAAQSIAEVFVKVRFLDDFDYDCPHVFDKQVTISAERLDISAVCYKENAVR